MSFPRIATLKTAEEFSARVAELGLSLPVDETLEHGPDAPLARPIQCGSTTVGNRFCVLPMEGWDGTTDGRPTELIHRRWRNFGVSGAKLIWGGEAIAVRPDGRANPNQLFLSEETLPEIASLRETLVAAHRECFDRDDDLLVGLQLTHSGRFSRPHGTTMSPRVAYRHPLLDGRFGVKDNSAVLTDDDVARLVDDFVAAAKRAQRAGFAFVDVKHCHGYLGHEFLSAHDRPGRYGGSFENRTRFLREIVAGVRAEAPGLAIGVRLSVFDFAPFQKGSDLVGEPMAFDRPYRLAFGGDTSGTGIDLAEPFAFCELLLSLGIELLCVSAGTPYYCPHVLRPAAFPPSDGYLPPEDPLVGVARHLRVAAEIKARCPRMIVVGSGYSYLQDWLAHVGQGVVRRGEADFVGLGRMMLSYPEYAADVLAGRPLARKKICRTFSDCTTAPRNGMVSGCYPLDPFYKDRPERERVQQIKSQMQGGPPS